MTEASACRVKASLRAVCSSSVQAKVPVVCCLQLAAVWCGEALLVVRDWPVVAGGVQYSHLEKTFGDYPPVNEVRRRMMRARSRSCSVQEELVVQQLRRRAAGAGSGKESSRPIAAAIPLQRHQVLCTCTLFLCQSDLFILSVVVNRSNSMQTWAPRWDVMAPPRAVLNRHASCTHTTNVRYHA